ncbi:MAG: Fic family protein [Steroidobacteraceae bacterium]
MATPQEKLAESLEALEALQKREVVAVRSSDLSRTHRERLLRGGFLQEVMKGWYIPSRPDEARGESTAWYASFWDFCAAYLTERFGEEWSLSPEQSLFIHTGNRTVPRQLLVRSPKARNKVTALAHDTSLFENRATVPPRPQAQIVDRLRLFTLPAALIATGPGLFTQNPTDARTALAMVRDASDVLAILLEGGHTIVAGRLAGALRNIGRGNIADDIVQAMRSAGYDARESDPFEERAPLPLPPRPLSPYVTRMRLSWQEMRDIADKAFPRAPGLPKDKAAYLKTVDEIYVEDAYHSLSIEGYRVSRELIERVRSGAWNPDGNAGDRQQRDAMAAKGYHEAFQMVRDSVSRVLDGDNPGAVVERDHGAWYRALFAPSVSAGIVGAADLAGYRGGQVYIRRSKHVPPKHEAVRDLMPTLFELLAEESFPGARTALGHFMFVYIHPYMDGNGRVGRFLMNVMLASAGYPWTIIPVERRDEYMAALEAASVGRDIRPFADFVGDLVRVALKR